MAVTAESVVIPILADPAGAEAGSARAARALEKAANQMVVSAGKAEGAFKNLGFSLSNLSAPSAAASRATSQIVTNSDRAAAASRNLGRQIGDIGTQLAGGQSPFLIIAQQAPQVADALADTGGKAAKLAAFFAGPWGAAALAAGSVLGVLIGKLLESGNAAATAEKHLHEFANAQIDLGKFIDQTTGKLIAQNAQMARLTAARLPAQILAKHIETQGTVNQAFAAARAVGGYQLDRGRVSGNRSVFDATQAAGGNVQALFRNISAAAKANPADKQLQSLVVTIGDLAGKAQEGALGIRELENQGARLTTALNGGTVATKASVDANIRRATATTAVAKAQANLADVEARWAQIEAMDEGSAKVAAVAKYERDVIAATRAVEGAEAATKAHNKAISEGEREARRQAEIWEKIEIASRNISANLSKIKGLGLDSLGLGDWKDKPDVSGLSFDDVRRIGDEKIDGRVAVGMEAAHELYVQQQDNIRSLADLYETAFTQGSKGIAETFKREMLAAVATALARFTLTGKFDLGSTGGLLGSLAGLFGGSSSSAISTSLGSWGDTSILGHAGGGNAPPNSLIRVNEQGTEFLRVGGQGGEIIPLGQTRAAMGGGTTVYQPIHADFTGAVVTQDLIDSFVAIADSAAVRGASGGSQMAQAALARSAKYRLG